MGKVTKRVVTGFTLALVATALIQLSRASFLPAGSVPWAAAGLLALLGAGELARMGSLVPRRLGRGLVVGWLAITTLTGFWLLPCSSWVRPGNGIASLAAAAGIGIALAAVVRLAMRPARAGDVGWSAFGAAWAVAPLFAILVVDLQWGTRGLIALVVCSKTGDIFGYFVGRAIGKSHPFPRISPGKTTAGCVASLVAGTLAGGLMALAGTPVQGAGFVAGLVAGAGLNLASQAGDLLESWVKRTAGVKDSSRLAAAAGGVLDVVDSLLLSAPVALVLWAWLF